MARGIRSWLMLVCGFLLILGVDSARGALPDRTVELRDALAKTIHYGGLEDNKATLLDALDQVATQVKASRGVELTFDLNDNAFKAELPGMDVGKMEVAATAPIPPMDAALSTVLKKILARIAIPSGAVYVLRKDRIEITTGMYVADEFYPRRARPPFSPLVIVSFENKPLDKALSELAGQTQRNVVLDVRAGKAGKTSITADFLNVPLNEAVLLLADMANLDSVPVGRTYYVTTRENAKTLRAAQQREQRARLQRKKQLRSEAKPEPVPPDGPGDKPVSPALAKPSAPGKDRSRGK
jgi:DNA-directed RNA polymerase subunit K/omega